MKIFNITQADKEKAAELHYRIGIKMLAGGYARCIEFPHLGKFKKGQIQSLLSQLCARQPSPKPPVVNRQKPAAATYTSSVIERNPPEVEMSADSSVRCPSCFYRTQNITPGLMNCPSCYDEMDVQPYVSRSNSRSRLW